MADTADVSFVGERGLRLSGDPHSEGDARQRAADGNTHGRGAGDHAAVKASVVITVPTRTGEAQVGHAGGQVIDHGDRPWLDAGTGIVHVDRVVHVGARRECAGLFLVDHEIDWSHQPGVDRQVCLTSREDVRAGGARGLIGVGIVLVVEASAGCVLDGEAVEPSRGGRGDEVHRVRARREVVEQVLALRVCHLGRDHRT